VGVVVAELKPNTKEFVPSKPLGVASILGPPPVAHSDLDSKKGKTPSGEFGLFGPLFAWSFGKATLYGGLRSVDFYS
jgi:hypothetical protein